MACLLNRLTKTGIPISLGGAEDVVGSGRSLLGRMDGGMTESLSLVLILEALRLLGLEVTLLVLLCRRGSRSPLLRLGGGTKRILGIYRGTERALRLLLRSAKGILALLLVPLTLLRLLLLLRRPILRRLIWDRRPGLLLLLLRIYLSSRARVGSEVLPQVGLTTLLRLLLLGRTLGLTSKALLLPP